MMYLLYTYILLATKGTSISFEAPAVPFNSIHIAPWVVYRSSIFAQNFSVFFFFRFAKSQPVAGAAHLKLNA